jgi:hypothetical protein
MRICVRFPSDNERLLAACISFPHRHAGTLHPGDNNCSTTGTGHHCFERQTVLMQRTTLAFVSRLIRQV